MMGIGEKIERHDSLDFESVSKLLIGYALHRKPTGYDETTAYKTIATVMKPGMHR